MTDAGQDKPRRLRFRFPVWGIIPVVAAALLGAFLWSLLHPSPDLPSALIGRPMPAFALPPIKGRADGLQTADLNDRVVLVNFFASWCVPCRAEIPLFLELSRSAVVPIYGIDFKDKPEKILPWLQEAGDPYTRIGADGDGRTGIEFGVYGMPETFVVDAKGAIAYRLVGPVTRSNLDQTILPLIRRLQQDAGKSNP